MALPKTRNRNSFSHPKFSFIISPEYVSRAAPSLLRVTRVGSCRPQAAALAPAPALSPCLNRATVRAHLLHAANPSEQLSTSPPHLRRRDALRSSIHFIPTCYPFRALFVYTNHLLRWTVIIVNRHHPRQPSHVPTTHPLRQLDDIPTRLTPLLHSERVVPFPALLCRCLLIKFHLVSPQGPSSRAQVPRRARWTGRAFEEA